MSSFERTAAAVPAVESEGGAVWTTVAAVSAWAALTVRVGS